MTNTNMTEDATRIRALPGFYNDLDASLAHAWAMIGRGVADRRSAFHTPVVATVDGGASFDAQVIDEDGTVYVELKGYRTVQLPGTVSL